MRLGSFVHSTEMTIKSSNMGRFIRTENNEHRSTWDWNSFLFHTIPGALVFNLPLVYPSDYPYPQLDPDFKGIYLPSMSLLDVRPVLLREDTKTQSNESF